MTEAVDSTVEPTPRMRPKWPGRSALGVGILANPLVLLHGLDGIEAAG